MIFLWGKGGEWWVIVLSISFSSPSGCSVFVFVCLFVCLFFICESFVLCFVLVFEMMKIKRY